MGRSRAHKVPFLVQLSPPPRWLNAGPFREEIPSMFQPFTSQESPQRPPPYSCCLASEGWSLKLDLGGQRINRKGGVGISN